ncbi:MAG: sigma factor-like helix-turn-helix DNA-binding protein [Polyangiaceae bacterium]
MANLFRKKRPVLDDAACEAARALDNEEERRVWAFTMDYRSRLPERRRDAFDAIVEDDESQKELAARKGINYSTFKTRVQKERKAFRIALAEYLALLLAWLKRRSALIGTAAAAAAIAWLLFVPPTPTCDASVKTGDGYAYQRFLGQCGIGHEPTNGASDLKFVDAGPVPGLYLIADGEVLVGYIRRQRGTDVNDPTVQVTPGSYAAVANHTGQDVIFCVGRSDADCRTIRSGESASTGKWPLKWFRTSRSIERNLLESASKPMPLVYQSGDSEHDVSLSAGTQPFPPDWQKQLASGQPGKYRVRIDDRGATMKFTLSSVSEAERCRACGSGTACINLSGSGLFECVPAPNIMTVKSQPNPRSTTPVRSEERAHVYGQ